jgi:hypothetical protein
LASTPSHFIAFHLRSIAKIEANIDTLATQLADGYVVNAFVMVIRKSHTPTQFGNVKYI